MMVMRQRCSDAITCSAVTATDLVERLAAHKTVGSAPREELAWLVAHGSLRHLATNEALSTKGTPVAGLFIVLTGHVAIYLDRGAGRHKVMEWRAGDVAGVLPYSRLVSPPGDSVAQEPSEIFAIPRADLGAMIRDCHEITSLLVHKMLDRSRVFVSSGLQDEKMLSLGKLSAGLAHELNNPVSAIGRNAALLAERLDESDGATRAIGLARLTEAQLDAIDTLRAACLAARGHDVLTPIQRANREDAIADWLSDHAVDTDLAGPLADSAVTLAALDQIASMLAGAPLAPVLRSVAAGCSVREIASEIQDASRRISGLVAAIKGFTHMDQAVVAEPVDLTAGLGHTVAVLTAKARLKSIAVTVDVEPGLPLVRGFVGELNQIWANLIDNALDAVAPDGRVDITARHERQHVVVRVIDNGPGIPADLRARIFDPFFTTKPVGQGTGLGLDIVRRLVNHNDAEVDVESIPGRTTFRVALPVATLERAKAAGAGTSD
jgi:signal transduction histidine kinase